jgi:hypothetical protein
MELDPREVLGADEAVLARANETDRRAMIAVERPVVEVLGDQHIVVQRVLDRHNRPVAVETRKDYVGDRGGSIEDRLDDLAVEGCEGDALPSKVDRRPPSNAVEVGGELPAG